VTVNSPGDRRVCKGRMRGSIRWMVVAACSTPPPVAPVATTPPHPSIDAATSSKVDRIDALRLCVYAVAIAGDDARFALSCDSGVHVVDAATLE
jgi:hypothetical protein